MRRIDIGVEAFIRRLLAHPRWPRLPQALVLAFALPALAALFLGPEQGERNPGSFLLWHLWWAALPAAALLLGRTWCALCPVSLLAAALGARLRPLSWPALLARREGLLLAGSLLLVHLLYLRLGLEENVPAARGFIAAMLALAVAGTLLLRGRPWCRSLCPAGAFSGVLARQAPWRIAADPSRCGRTCGGTPCRAADGGGLCPVGEDPRRGIDPGMCVLCGDCITACPAVAPVRDRPAALPPSAAAPTLVLLGVVADGLLVQINDWPILFWRLSSGVGAPPAAWVELSLHALVCLAPLLAAAAIARSGGSGAFADRLALIAGAALPLAAAAAAAIAARALLVAAPQQFAELAATGGHPLSPLGAFGRAIDGAPMRALQEAAVALGLLAALRRLAPALRDPARRATAIAAALLCAGAAALLAWGLAQTLGLS